MNNAQTIAIKIKVLKFIFLMLEFSFKKRLSNKWCKKILRTELGIKKVPPISVQL